MCLTFFYLTPCVIWTVKPIFMDTTDPEECLGLLPYHKSVEQTIRESFRYPTEKPLIQFFRDQPDASFILCMAVEEKLMAVAAMHKLIVQTKNLRLESTEALLQAKDGLASAMRELIEEKDRLATAKDERIKEKESRLQAEDRFAKMKDKLIKEADSTFMRRTGLLENS
jgi:hypothetical protein